MIEPSETEVRDLRRQVYGKDCTDHGWEQVKRNWMRPDSVAWLRERAKIELTDHSKNGGAR